ncbi:unnamed protein product [Calypogeia fissa]
MRMKLRLLLAFVVGVLTSLQSAAQAPSAATCPLNFDDVPPSSPYCLSSTDSNDVQSCCYASYYHLAVSLARNTNSTSQLFLDAPQESACAQVAQNNTIVPSYCPLAPPSFTANGGSCLFAKESDLEDALLNTSVPFANLLATCANIQQGSGCPACSQIYNAAIDVLKNQTGNATADTNCGAALLVSLISRNFFQLDWRNSILACLEIPLTLAAASSSTGKKSTDLTPVLGTLLGVCVCLIFVGAIVYHRKSRGFEIRGGHGGVEKDHSSVESDAIKQGEAPANEGTLYEFSAKELSRATDGYSDKNIIGEGNNGKVYRGALPSGQLVAIKLIMKDEKSETSFYKEIENLSRVRHPNLVTLLGYCQTADKSLLVYEYCPKGSLWYYLFGGGPTLTWDQRLNIALGSARGLMYLHMNPGGYIVHRDIKPTNILLTDNYEAKVSDFGLSRFIPIEETRVFTEVKGTAGYLDPEYVNQGTLTFSSDVYSFGVVLLQLISGRRPIDLDPLTKVSLVKMANFVMKGEAEISDLVDPKLHGVYSELACRRVLEIAVQCTADYRVYRPSMIEVRQYLEEAWVLGGSPISYETTPPKKKQEIEGQYSPYSAQGGERPLDPPRESWQGAFGVTKDDQGR